MLHCKYSKPKKLIKLFPLFSVLVLYVIPTIYGLAFLHANIGVVFSPYVHKEVDYENIHNDWSSYSLSDVETMAKVISTRFPKLVLYGIGSRWFDNDTDKYNWDSNYHHSYSQVFMSEAVAKFNNATHSEQEEIKEKGKDEHHEPLQVYQGVLISSKREKVDLELFVAVEAVSKANHIFPGTVKGIVFHSQAEMQKDAASATLLLDVMKKVELKAAQYQLEIGTKQNCDGIYDGNSESSGKLRQIVLHSNFIICEINPKTDLNVTDAVVLVINQIQKFREELRTLNPWLDVMFETGWPADQNNKSEVSDLQTFWEYMESWSLKNDVSLWMNEAFDNPWSYTERKGHWGWWNLKDDKGTSKENEYIEKIPHKGKAFTKKTRGKAVAEGRKRLEKLEKLLPPEKEFGRVEKRKTEGGSNKTEKVDEDPAGDWGAVNV